MGTYLIILLDFLIIGFGYLYYKSYENWLLFYSDLLSLTQSFNNTVLLLNTPIKIAIEEYDYKNKYTKPKLINLINNDNASVDNENSLKYNNLSDIKAHLNLIANSFGDQTKEHIENLEQLVKQNLLKAEKLKNERGMLYFKLSVILALAFTILMF